MLWQIGVTGFIQEMAPDGTIVWQARWPADPGAGIFPLAGNATPVADLYDLVDR